MAKPPVSSNQKATLHSLIGNLDKIWEEYNGAGVKVGVYDDGLQLDHHDLADNYDASLHVLDAYGNPHDPSLSISDRKHGTAVAGVIAAVNNETGAVGIAWGASLTGVDYISNNSQSNSALMQGTKFDVINQSYGVTVTFPHSYTNYWQELYTSTLQELTSNGRDGLGTIVVKAAGNSDNNATAQVRGASMYNIHVAATSDRSGLYNDGISTSAGMVERYSSYGPSILVAAPITSNTTDLMEGEGYTGGDYTSFNGTSSAAPAVSGVVALMLEANGDLGWRDVQNILAASATFTGTAYGQAKHVFEDGVWQYNNAETWNGGGMHIHTNYGYGLVNAYNAVRMAEVWSLFNGGAQITSNQTVTLGALNAFAAPLQLADGTGDVSQITFNIAADILVEHVTLSIDLNTARINDLLITLVSSSGTVITVFSPGDTFDANGGEETVASQGFNGLWDFEISQLRGEESGGTWTVQISDQVSGNLTTIRDVQLKVSGQDKVDGHKVYHVTDEWALAVAHGTGSAQIGKGYEGSDWLSLATVSTNITASLAYYAAYEMGTWVGPVNGLLNFGVNSGTISTEIKNLVAGDGNDVLTGNQHDNALYGMRGNDTIYGGLGADTLDGGAGVNYLYGGDGNDTYYVRTENDFVIEAADGGIDHIISSINYTLGGYVENLTLSGAGSLIGYGNAGDNTLRSEAGSAALYGEAGNDILYGGTGNDSLYGGSGDDTLAGGAGTNLLVGGAGNDYYIVTSAADIIEEESDDGTDTVEADFDFTLNANLENLILAGTGHIDGIGNTLNNAITGNVGNNSLSGMAGDDTLYGSAGDDNLYGGDGEDSLYGGLGNDYLAGDEGNDSLYGGSGNDTLIGGAGTNLLVGGSGNDYYIVTSITDTIEEKGGGGNDTVEAHVDFTLSAHLENLVLGGTSNLSGIGSASHDTITGNAGDNSLSGMAGNDKLYGGDGNDTLYGGAGNDTLAGGAGANLLVGGSGNDYYIVTSTEDLIEEEAEGGTDTVEAHVDFTLSDNLERLILAGTSNLSGVGNASNNTITGNIGDNSLSGMAGNDKLYGGAGSDTLYGGDGDDSLYGGMDNDYLAGGTGDDSLYGGSGNDTLVGGAGTNSLVGGSGNDYYIVTSTTDIIEEKANGGTDTVEAHFDFTLTAHLERLILAGTSNLSGVGNAANNTITGNVGDNSLSGLDGNDKLYGGAGNDSLYGGTGNDSLYGGMGNDSLVGDEGNDSLYGGSGNDTLVGGAGLNLLVGGSGNDYYIVTSTTDIIEENAGGGTDTVEAHVNFTLHANLEKLILVGASNLVGTGNDLNNTITGNAGNSTLRGMDGNDKLYGGAGNDFLYGGDGDDSLYGGLDNDYLVGDDGDDSLYGGSGDDTLVGGAGTNLLVGGSGNDTYVVSSASDIIEETATGGIDLMQASFNATLSANVENLHLTGSATDGTGNALDNIIWGNTNDNALYGGEGNDTIYGGFGNDSLSGGSGNDQLSGGDGDDSIHGDAGNDNLLGGGGSDTMWGGEGNDLLSGQADDDLLYGNDGNDTIYGGDGNDTIYGSAGADVLYGGAGADTFVFEHTSESMIGAYDLIYDFEIGVDRIDLRNIDANINLADDQAFTFIGTSAFSGVAGQLRLHTYTNGVGIIGDTNGDGIGDMEIALLGTNLATTLTSAHFYL